MTGFDQIFVSSDLDYKNFCALPASFWDRDGDANCRLHDLSFNILIRSYIVHCVLGDGIDASLRDVTVDWIENSSRLHCVHSRSVVVREKKGIEIPRN